MAVGESISTKVSSTTQSDTAARTDLAVRAEQIRLLYQQANSSLAATLIVATAVSALLYGKLPELGWAIWYGLLLAVTLSRFILVRRYLSISPASENAPAWEKYFIFGAGAAGMVWGMLGLLAIFRTDISHQAFVTIALAGMAAGATSSLSSSRQACAVFLLPMLLPFCLTLIANGGTFQIAMGFLVLAFTGTLLAMSRRIYQTIAQSLTLGYENNALLKEQAEAKQDAEVANRTKSEFLANMSHEIRTPLTAIIGFTESIMDGDQTPEALANATQIILRNSRLLLEIIDDILDLSKIEANKLDVENLPYSPIQVVRDVEKAMSLRAAEKGLTLQIGV